MAVKESLRDPRRRIRFRRAEITYDVEVGGTIENREWPFVVGVLGDFSGQPEQPLPRLRDRKFIFIDRDNFDSVLAGMRPRLALSVENKLSSDNSKIAVEFRFNRREDFEPDNLVQQVEPLRRLLEARQHLSDLLSNLDGNSRLEHLLQEVVSNRAAQQQLCETLGLEAAARATDPVIQQEQQNSASCDLLSRMTMTRVHTRRPHTERPI